MPWLFTNVNSMLSHDVAQRYDQERFPKMSPHTQHSV